MNLTSVYLSAHTRKVLATLAWAVGTCCGVSTAVVDAAAEVDACLFSLFFLDTLSLNVSGGLLLKF